MGCVCWGPRPSERWEMRERARHQRDDERRREEETFCCLLGKECPSVKQYRPFALRRGGLKLAGRISCAAVGLLRASLVAPVRDGPCYLGWWSWGRSRARTSYGVAEDLIVCTQRTAKPGCEGWERGRTACACDRWRWRYAAEGGSEREKREQVAILEVGRDSGLVGLLDGLRSGNDLGQLGRDACLTLAVVAERQRVQHLSGVLCIDGNRLHE